ncbi:hypothetical protein LTS09_001285 [Friedmanniomyces endolithicus]|nr:hypothetical protein LTS09_001285 [Friedmanniomyces endolithicus]
MTSQASQAAKPSSEKKMAGPSVEERSIAPSDTASTAPILPEAQHGTPHDSGSTDAGHKSLLQRLKDTRSEHKSAHKSISDSGPYELVFDPKLGKEVMRKNPHWPNEDSYLRENTGLTVKKGMESAPDSVKQQTGTWGQTSDSSAQDYFNGYIRGV